MLPAAEIAAAAVIQVTDVDSDDDLSEVSSTMTLAETTTSATTVIDGDSIPMRDLSLLLSTSNEISAWKTKRTRLFPFFTLASRLYEAHFMIAHLFVLILVSNLYPTVAFSDGSISYVNLGRSLTDFRFYDLITAPMSVSALSPKIALVGWFRIPLLASSSAESVGTVWILPDIVAFAFLVVGIVGKIGPLATILACIFHDYYHHQGTTVRWGNSALAEAGALIKRDDKDIEGDAAVPFNSRYLGIRPTQTSSREWPGALLDFLAIPAAVVIGLVPLVYAQFRHLWTDRLTYVVSAKPTVQQRKKITPVEVAS
jgi:hypothetical protein